MIKHRVKYFWVNLTRKQIATFLIFCCAAVFAFLMAKYGEQVSKFGYYVLFAELAIVVVITWGMAGHSVMKALFGVSASLSLLIYIAQSYCEAPQSMHTGDTALISLVGFGILYISFEFFQTLRQEIQMKLGALKEVNDQKALWFIGVPYGLFTGIFTWQIIQVLTPIINSLCIYQK